MNHQSQPAGADWFSVLLSWIGNGIGYFMGGMNPLQALALLFTIIFTGIQIYVFVRDKFPRK